MRWKIRKSNVKFQFNWNYFFSCIGNTSIAMFATGSYALLTGHDGLVPTVCGFLGIIVALIGKSIKIKIKNKGGKYGC